MKVKCTKVMAKELQKAVDDLGYSVSCLQVNERQYGLYVDFDTCLHDNDYNPKTNKFSVLEIIYPCDLYSIPHYVTTNDLIKLFRGLGEKTLDNFKLAFRDLVMI